MKTITSDEDRGQVGIGTLIIFIALVLVAAVAAGVLVNTAGLLQSQAEDTGSDAQAQVSNQIDVVSVTGLNTDGTNDKVETVTMVVKKSPGSDPIDLAAATIEYTSDTSTQTLTQDTAADADSFSTADLTGTNDEVLDDNGDRIEITVSLTQIEAGATDDGLAAGEEATLQIVDQSGASTIYGVNVPDVLTGKDYVRV
jgi:flagellin-like protein